MTVYVTRIADRVNHAAMGPRDRSTATTGFGKNSFQHCYRNFHSILYKPIFVCTYMLQSTGLVIAAIAKWMEYSPQKL